MVDLEEIYRLVSKINNFMPCGSVFDSFCVEALKMLENAEKPSFTFFAFLPPYIGVSGYLVSRKCKSVKRSIDWYQKFLIPCLAAWYSTVFVLRRSNWLKISKNNFLRFWPFYPFISAFQALSCPSCARSR